MLESPSILNEVLAGLTISMFILIASLLWEHPGKHSAIVFVCTLGACVAIPAVFAYSRIQEMISGLFYWSQIGEVLALMAIACMALIITISTYRKQHKEDLPYVL